MRLLTEKVVLKNPPFPLHDPLDKPTQLSLSSFPHFSIMASKYPPTAIVFVKSATIRTTIKAIVHQASFLTSRRTIKNHVLSRQPSELRARNGAQNVCPHQFKLRSLLGLRSLSPEYISFRFPMLVSAEISVPIDKQGLPVCYAQRCLAFFEIIRSVSMKNTKDPVAQMMKSCEFARVLRGKSLIREGLCTIVHATKIIFCCITWSFQYNLKLIELFWNIAIIIAFLAIFFKWYQRKILSESKL